MAVIASSPDLIFSALAFFRRRQKELLQVEIQLDFDDEKSVFPEKEADSRAATTTIPLTLVV